MKILITGNHTCGNRGDSAILRGLLSTIERLAPQADIVLTSRYPDSSSFLLGRRLRHDVFHKWHLQHDRGIRRITYRWGIPLLMASAIRTGWRVMQGLLPKEMRREIEYISGFDAVVQVGGSFFVDFYGPTQFEYSLAAILTRRPLFLIGHSMGPFSGYLYQFLAHTLLTSAAKVALRELVSRDIIKKFNLPIKNVVNGSDTAWLVAASTFKQQNKHMINYEPIRKRAIVGVSFRNLSPFDKRLNTRQEDYESALAAMINHLIASDCDVVAVSTCTGIDSYHHDDRMVALRVRAKVTYPSHFRIVMDELNDIELGELLGQCTFVIGTRLHCAIIAMNFGTPAITIAYEHKSTGIMEQLGLSDLSYPIESIIDGSLAQHALVLINDIEALQERVSMAVNRERKRALAMVTDCLCHMQTASTAF